MHSTEFNKMIDGRLYDANDSYLSELRLKSRGTCFEINKLSPDESSKKKKLLKTLFGRLGENFEILSPFYCDYGINIVAGNNLYINFNCTILDCNIVSIGDNVFFGPNVQIYTAFHPLNAEERIKGPELALPVTIGDKVWLGGGVIVCQNVNIGNNTTIGAGSVVTRDIPANVFAAGNPCRVIKKLSDSGMD